MNDTLKCEACDSTTIEAIVKHGSYVLRCANCGEGIVATSFLALRNSEHTYSAYRDPGFGQSPKPGALIAMGPLKEIYALVSSVAGKGESVLLIGSAQQGAPGDAPKAARP